MAVANTAAEELRVPMMSTVPFHRSLPVYRAHKPELSRAVASDLTVPMRPGIRATWPTRLAIPSATMEAVAPASLMTAVAASSVNPPAKIANRRSRVRSDSGNSS